MSLRDWKDNLGFAVVADCTAVAKVALNRLALAEDKDVGRSQVAGDTEAVVVAGLGRCSVFGSDNSHWNSRKGSRSFAVGLAEMVFVPLWRTFGSSRTLVKTSRSLSGIVR